jgi:hypothetical protein
MATNQPARGGAAEGMSEFVQRRNREQAARGQARAAEHQAFGQAIRAGHDLGLKKSSNLATQGAEARAMESAPSHQELEPNFLETPYAPIGHPGTLESFIPVWGSGREALADLEEGKPVSAAFNAGLAALDLTGIGMLDKVLAKGGIYAVKGAIGESAAQGGWRAVRRKMGDLKILEPYQHGHHWFIPQNGWGKKVPNLIKNHPANIHGMPSREIHGRLHGRYKGKPEFGFLHKYWHGTPHLSKVATGSAAGHAASAAASNGRRK